MVVPLRGHHARADGLIIPWGDSLAIFGTKGGAPIKPDWYYDLLTHPETTVEVGTETIPVVARMPSERPKKRDNPGFADHEKQTASDSRHYPRPRRVKPPPPQLLQFLRRPRREPRHLTDVATHAVTPAKYETVS
jgi:hypothetical protein